MAIVNIRSDAPAILPAQRSSLAPEYGDFLRSPLWEDHAEMPLSALSALARLDLDPWAEAAALAGLPSETGVDRLALRLRALPGCPSNRTELDFLCRQAIRLLPAASQRSGAAQTAAVVVINPIRAAMFALLFLIIYVSTIVLSGLAEKLPDPAHEAAGLGSAQSRQVASSPASSH